MLAIPLRIGERNDNLKINVDITHSYIGDFLIQLQHPNGINFQNIWVGNCGSNDNLDITFSDDGAAIVCASPTVGEYAPANPLSEFNGLSAQGDWTIAVVDFFAGDTGTLNDWSIEVCETLSISETIIHNDFTIYPNPNKGSFVVALNSGIAEDISIDVYDLRGRQVYGKIYNGSDRFNQAIDLDVQSGIYLVKVSNGNFSETKKIIIE